MTTAELLASAASAATDFLATVQQRPVVAQATAEQLRASFGMPLNANGRDAGEVLRALVDAAEPGLVASAGPRYFGFVIGGSLPVTVAADWMTSAWDQNAGLYVASPAAAVAEDVVAEWLIDLFGLPKSVSTGFVTGCQMANFTALASARHAVLGAQGWDVEQHGLIGAPPVEIVVSAESHVTIYAALRLLGFGISRVRVVPADDQGRMRADLLADTLRGLDAPAIVCAQAGNVNSGAFDPIEEIAAIVHEHRGWLHVDGAFGLWAAASPALRHLVRGIELADSWATDAHKWLNVPYDSGLVFVRDANAHRASMALVASYLVASDNGQRDAFDWVPESSRRGRGFAIWAAMQTLGRVGIAELIERCCSHARLFAELLRRKPGITIANDVVLNQVLVRFGSDEITREVIARVQRGGVCWLGGTTWHGAAAMRISVSNWMTTEADVEQSVAAI
ncbi:MAG TPA: aminotransferase class V-fold PLP-dependent enzyme, partial [Thermoanaerobaculia bacterium]|nr:aminotransferase class V-fold PLP-dependent enzyme [Thermoanaerobaculia bacterium]